MPRAVDGRKVCSKCAEEKAVSEFTRHKYNGDGLEARCRACESARRSDPEFRAKARLRERNYQMRMNEAARRVESQL